MTLETSLIDSALRNWRSNVDRAGKLFGNLSQEQLLQEVAPGKIQVFKVHPVGDAKSNQRFRRTEGVFRGHKKPVCLAVQRLVWATDQALQRRRQDVGSPCATNSCTRASPGTHEWYDGTAHPWEFKRVWHLEPPLNDPDTVCKPVMFVPYPKCSEAIVRRLYDTARSSSLPAHRVAAISMAW
jgi:hypothetical protein